MSTERRLRLARTAWLARAVEDAMDRLAKVGDIGLPAPARDGVWAMVGASAALEAGDFLFGTRRDLPAAIGRGVPLSTIFCQIMGTTGDPSLGRGLPGTIHDVDHGVSLGDGGPAAHLVHAAGFGHAARLGGASRMALALFGSAAQANGDLHAALNFAAVNAANTVFMARGSLAGELSLVEVAPAWGIPATKVDGDDALAVYEALLVARERATSGQGPTLIDARLDAPARPLDAQALQAQGAFATEVEVGLKLEVAAEVAEALALARQAPPISEHTLFNDTFSDRPWFL